MWERLIRTTLLLIAVRAVTLVGPVKELLSDIDDIWFKTCSWIALVLQLLDYLRAPTRRLLPHWRTLALFTANIFVSLVGLAEVATSFVNQNHSSVKEGCVPSAVVAEEDSSFYSMIFGASVPETVSCTPVSVVTVSADGVSGVNSILFILLQNLTPFLKSNMLGFESIIELNNTMKVGMWLFPLLCFTAVLVALCPVPSVPSNTGRFKRVGTLTFNIPMRLSSADSQTYKRSTNGGKGQHGKGMMHATENNDGNENSNNSNVEEEYEVYDLPVQVWFPILKIDSKINRIRRFFRALHTTTTLWTSGHPEHQDAEIQLLVKGMCALGGAPPLTLQHLALARSNAEFVPTLKGMFGGAGEGISGIKFQGNGAATDPADTTTNKDKSKPMPLVVNDHNQFTLRDLPLFPAAIYSHGMYGWRQISSTTFENMASNGIIVFSIDHRPSAMCVR